MRILHATFGKSKLKRVAKIDFGLALERMLFILKYSSVSIWVKSKNI